MGYCLLACCESNVATGNTCGTHNRVTVQTHGIGHGNVTAAVTAVFATLNNIGPGTSALIGPLGSFSFFSPLSRENGVFCRSVGIFSVFVHRIRIRERVFVKVDTQEGHPERSRNAAKSKELVGEYRSFDYGLCPPLRMTDTVRAIKKTAHGM